MITGEQFATMALSFQGTETQPHFDRIGFRVAGKRMFATYLDTNNTANIFLEPDEQRIFCGMDSTSIYPVPNKWGEKGATTFDLNTAARHIVQEALLSAYQRVLQTKSRK